MRTSPPTIFDRPTARWASMALVLGALVAPVLLDRDDFPLSTYPMYSSARSSTVAFVTAQGVDQDGHVVELGLEAIGATDDPLIAAGELRAAIAAGDEDQRCRDIASRVERADGLVRVEVVTERHDVIDHTLGRPSLVERIVHASCPVGGAGSP